ncbi:MAG: glycosyltransferase family 39 protein [Candidatus Omnitrophota bacterium]
MKLNRSVRNIILLAIVLLGLSIRMYNINFPSLGYHAAKENEYISMAQEMVRTGDYITRRVYFYNAFEKEPIMNLYPQPALVPYQILISWRLLGENMWGPRLFNVIFGVLSIFVMYHLALLLFRNTALALFSALLLSIMPLAVFFSRNIQPESPAFFFMILGSMFYVKFITTMKRYDLFLGSLAFSVAWLYKFSFLIGVFPFIFCFPYIRMLKEKRAYTYALSFFLPYLLIIFTIIWLKSVGEWEWESYVVQRVKLFEIFSPAYWKQYGRNIWWYFKGENFTPVFTSLALLGIVIAFFKRRSLIDRYIIGCTLMAIPYGMALSDLICQHNYYQMPFLLLVCISVSYAVLHVSRAAIKLMA